MPTIPTYDSQVSAESGTIGPSRIPTGAFGFGGFDDVAQGLQEVSDVLHQSAVKDDLMSISKAESDTRIWAATRLQQMQQDAGASDQDPDRKRMGGACGYCRPGGADQSVTCAVAQGLSGVASAPPFPSGAAA